MEQERTNKILLIEDDIINGEMYQITFAQGGLECVWKTTGEDGLKELKTSIPALILLDVKLDNGMDGFDVLSILKKDKKLRSIPVWLLTNIWETGNKNKSATLGAEKFVLKTDLLPMDLLKKVKERLAMVS
ncbi:MAG TPA: response regulator [Patescibacteria group bacterium]|nr:response regulator [Patescibacteria group bacterium]